MHTVYKKKKINKCSPSVQKLKIDTRNARVAAMIHDSNYRCHLSVHRDIIKNNALVPHRKHTINYRVVTIKISKYAVKSDTKWQRVKLS